MKSVGVAEHNGLRFCETHTPPGATNLALHPCTKCGLEFLLVDGLCEYCDPDRVDRVWHKKEEGVAFALQDAGIEIYARDRVLEPGSSVCGLERPDFQILGAEGRWWVYVECDENQHEDRNPECELTRMRNLAEVRGQPVVFIRFNPDTYKSKSAAQMRVQDRYKVLTHWVRQAVDLGPRPGEVVSVLKLFYDGFDPGRPHWEALC
jgi:hypothetical protein